jgi:putative cell wall-binding protein
VAERQRPRPRDVLKLAAFVLAFALGISAVPVAPPPASAAAATISGRVTMPDGSPIDANVSIVIFTRIGWSDDDLALRNDGGFSFTPSGPGEFYVRLSYQGTDSRIPDAYYLPGTLVPEEAQPIVFTGASIVLDLPLMTGGYGDATTISGRVLANNRYPLDGWLDVIGCPVGGGACAEVAAPPHYFPLSGEFTLVLPGPGEYRLCFEPRPLSNLIASCWAGPDGDSITVTAGQKLSGITAGVEWGGSVKGRVVVLLEPWTGPHLGVVGSTVQLYLDEDGPDADPVAEMVVSASDGSFQFYGVPPGNYTLYADTSGASGDFPPLTSEFYGSARTWEERTAFEVEVGQTTGSLWLPVHPFTGDISGTVGYEDDGVHYVRGARAELWSLASGTPELVKTYFTDEIGRFAFSRIAPGTYVVRVEPATQYSVGVPRDLFNPEYWNDARYIWEADHIVVGDGTTAQLDFRLDARSIEFSRVTGRDRFETSVEVAQQVFGPSDVPDSGIPVVYLANGLNYPDALAAGPAAIQNGGVVLLTYPWSLPPIVKAELERLHPQRIVVVGGEPSVNASVVATLEDFTFGPDVDRITGIDRFGTSRAIAQDTHPGGAGVAFIATGMNYPDALAAGPPAGMLDAPIILVNGGANSLDEPTRTLLEDLGVEDVYVIGGTPSVSAGIFTDLQSEFGTAHVTRLTGYDRFGTAFAIAQEFYTSADIGYVATGLNFPDALAGGPAAAHFDGPLYLSRQDCLPAWVVTGVLDLRANGLVLLGGPPSLSASVENGIVCP